MPYKIIDGGRASEFGRDNLGLPLKPRPGPGKESRNSTRPISFLREVQIRVRTHARSGRGERGSSARGSPHREARAFHQRVTVKSRVVRTKGKGARALKDHIRYIQREGVGRDGTEPTPFSSEQDLTRESVTALTQEWGEDRHHFRFIISPEQGSELDLNAYTKRLMDRVSEDLKTPLQWVGVAHHNTDNPHVHVILRGKDERGEDLVLSRDYIARGMRALAEELATRELGLRNEFDIQRDIQKSIRQQRITPIDRGLEKEAALSPERLVDLRLAPASGQDFAIRGRTNRLARLQFLEEMGLAKELEAGVWRIDERMIDRLETLGTKNDVIKLLHRRMRGVADGVDVHFVTPTAANDGTIVGSVLHTGLADELHDRRFMLVEGTDKRVHHVMLPDGSRKSGNPEQGDTVAVRITSEAQLTKSDHNIAEVAARHEGIYRAPDHEREILGVVNLPPGVSARDYVENHRRRMNSLNRMGLVEEIGADSWRVPSNLVQTLSERRRTFLSVEVLVKARGKDIGREM